MPGSSEASRRNKKSGSYNSEDSGRFSDSFLQCLVMQQYQSNNSQHQQSVLEIPQGIGTQVTGQNCSAENVTPFAELNMAEVMTSNRTFQCPVCGRQLADKYMFRRHYMIHTGEKPYACPACPYRTIQKGDLKFHLIRKHQQTLE